MYQSIPSLTTAPPKQNPGEFFERAIFPPPGTKQVQNPDPWRRKILLKPYPGAIIFKNPGQQKKIKHETEIAKNNTEMHCETSKAQSF